ncbi:MAG TPA: HU family DNA-binding protein [Anaerolineales bacterium]|nr:HU family DNA-binding protein [Anaerolineales bacterium]
MPVKFNVTPRKDPRDQASQPKYYATVKSTGRIDNHGIAKSINNMSTVNSVDVAAVLEAFMNVVPDQLAEGKIVELGDFGSFRVSVSSEGAEEAADVNVRSITDVRVLFTPGKRFKKLLNTTEFEKFSEN